MESLLIAYDGSEAARHACRRGGELAARLNADVTLLMIGELIESGYGSTVPVAAVEVFHQVAAEGMELLRAAGVTVAAKRVEFGDPKRQIPELAQELGVTLIVLGHSGSGFSEFLMGSVAKHVMDHAECSVLIVR